MHILYIDLYTFTMIFIWRICPPIQGFSGGGYFPDFMTFTGDHFSYSNDLNV